MDLVFQIINLNLLYQQWLEGVSILFFMYSNRLKPIIRKWVEVLNLPWYKQYHTWTMGNKQTGYFVYNSAVEGPDFNYHQDYNQGPYNHEG